MTEGTGLPIKWYHKPVFVVVAILCIGPFALPLAWMSPGFTMIQKAVITVIAIAITIWLVQGSIELLKILLKSMKELQAILGT